jgi:DNA recombination protein RmuC
LAVLALVIKISSQTNSQLNVATSQVNERLKEMSLILQETHKGVGQRLDNTASVIGDLKNTLGKLEKTNQQIFEVSKDISGLQNLLRAPKFRGQMGETLLGNILDQVLPKEHFKLQYRFKNGETVDAIIYLGKNIAPIDAKFPLENFQAYLLAMNDDEKNAFKKKFIADVKNRINEISSKYILPDEATFDFALMYIPAENVYYETIIKQDLLSYALNKKVIPVSPNTFYAYLQVICLGLKGLQVERNAKEILANLGRLQQDMLKFDEDFRLVGSHIQNALRKYEDADKRLGRFQEKLIASSRSSQENPQIENLVEK